MTFLLETKELISFRDVSFSGSPNYLHPEESSPGRPVLLELEEF